MTATKKAKKAREWWVWTHETVFHFKDPCIALSLYDGRCPRHGIGKGEAILVREVLPKRKGKGETCRQAIKRIDREIR
jgi:hypothetical protein